MSDPFKRLPNSYWLPKKSIILHAARSESITLTFCGQEIPERERRKELPAVKRGWRLCKICDRHTPTTTPKFRLGDRVHGP